MNGKKIIKYIERKILPEHFRAVKSSVKALKSGEMKMTFKWGTSSS